eukprot:SAG11_NODE_971_length_6351_cov_4.531190_4_plen_253_part_00
MSLPLFKWRMRSWSRAQHCVYKAPLTPYNSGNEHRVQAWILVRDRAVPILADDSLDGAYAVGSVEPDVEEDDVEEVGGGAPARAGDTAIDADDCVPPDREAMSSVPTTLLWLVYLLVLALVLAYAFDLPRNVREWVDWGAREIVEGTPVWGRARVLLMLACHVALCVLLLTTFKAEEPGWSKGAMQLRLAIRSAHLFPDMSKFAASCMHTPLSQKLMPNAAAILFPKLVDLRERRALWLRPRPRRSLVLHLV